METEAPGSVYLFFQRAGTTTIVLSSIVGLLTYFGVPHTHFTSLFVGDHPIQKEVITPQKMAPPSIDYEDENYSQRISYSDWQALQLKNNKDIIPQRNLGNSDSNIYEGATSLGELNSQEIKSFLKKYQRFVGTIYVGETNKPINTIRLTLANCSKPDSVTGYIEIPNILPSDAKMVVTGTFSEDVNSVVVLRLSYIYTLYSEKLFYADLYLDDNESLKGKFYDSNDVFYSNFKLIPLDNSRLLR